MFWDLYLCYVMYNKVFLTFYFSTKDTHYAHINMIYKVVFINKNIKKKTVYNTYLGMYIYFYLYIYKNNYVYQE